jgi:hypothetical protein
MNPADEARWTFEAVQQLIALAKERLPVSVISLKLKRPEPAVRTKLAELGITSATES